MHYTFLLTDHCNRKHFVVNTDLNPGTTNNIYTLYEGMRTNVDLKVYIYVNYNFNISYYIRHSIEVSFSGQIDVQGGIKEVIIFNIGNIIITILDHVHTIAGRLLCRHESCSG